MSSTTITIPASAASTAATYIVIPSQLFWGVFKVVARDGQQGWAAVAGPLANKPIVVGFYASEEAAARAHDAAAPKHFRNAIVNILPNGSLNPDRKKRQVDPVVLGVHFQRFLAALPPATIEVLRVLCMCV